MRAWTPFIFFSGLVCLASTPTGAASLQVAPTSFELPPGKAADTLTLHNDGAAPVNAQARVYRWSQVDGEEKLEPTTDVVASPPAVTIGPNADQVVRLVRVAKTPISKEESYRVVVDELPDKGNLKPNQITMTFKYSVPIFFLPEAGGKSQLTWTIERKNDKSVIVAKNNGSRRVRVGGLTLKAPGAKDFVLGKGLNGYVLSGSSMRWVLPSTVAVGGNGPVTITARSDEGPINATAQAQDSIRR